jgi:hypothetical protein
MKNKGSTNNLNEKPYIFGLHIFTSKRKWVPFMDQIRNREINKSIDFANLEIKIPLISENLGFYDSIKYEFNDATLI